VDVTIQNNEVFISQATHGIHVAMQGYDESINTKVLNNTITATTFFPGYAGIRWERTIDCQARRNIVSGFDYGMWSTEGLDNITVGGNSLTGLLHGLYVSGGSNFPLNGLAIRGNTLSGQVCDLTINAGAPNQGGCSMSNNTLVHGTACQTGQTGCVF
jgi:hypothetical protein